MEVIWSPGFPEHEESFVLGKSVLLFATTEFSAGRSCLLSLRHPYTAGGKPCLLWFLMQNFAQRLNIPVGCPFTAVLLRPAVQPQDTISQRATNWWHDKRKVHHEASKWSALWQSRHKVRHFYKVKLICDYLKYTAALSQQGIIL